MIKTIAAIVTALCLGTGAASGMPAEPMAVDKAFVLEASRADHGTALTWQVADGYYLYRDHFRISVNGEDVVFDVSEGVEKSDPGFGDVEVLYHQAKVTVPVRSGTAQVTFQGCQDGGICYRPEVRYVDLASLEIQAEPAARSTVDRGGDGASLADAGIVLADDADPSSAILRGSNPVWIAISFLGFGLLLAFTPCVFPMYPSVLGMLGRGGAGSSATRGFVLSSAYVLSLAFAFGLVGAVVGWTGQNIQFALQSPLTTLVMAVLFVVLAAASFGAFELQLPNFVTSPASKLQAGQGGSVGQAAALGFTSSLIVGPCVTAPLAGALLYIGQGGDWRVGALALFMLGLGKGLPLIALSTLGSRLLPKAGRWMETVRRLFGFAFIGMAIWIATPLMPVGYDVALYAMLALVLAADLVVRARIRSSKTATLVIAIVAGGGLVGLVADGIGITKATARISITSQVPPKSPLTFHKARSAADLVKEFQAADGKPLLVYVMADWCVICRTIERSVLPDAEVVAALEGMRLVKLDVTEFDEESQAVLRQLKVAGPPTMVFFSVSRREVADTRLVGEVSVAAVARSAGLASR
ncbi:protein-disulfide reductase DsbD [Mesorhizobium sp. ANAO-SY3R2]|uniref:protein-disulfide reductase DsbD n=1 Tax=Mesorhizobium sp. ANAO-SY3R2 TaxID=3166644 RepID=UPI00366E0A89